MYSFTYIPISHEHPTQYPSTGIFNPSGELKKHLCATTEFSSIYRTQSLLCSDSNKNILFCHENILLYHNTVIKIIFECLEIKTTILKRVGE